VAKKTFQVPQEDEKRLPTDSLRQGMDTVLFLKNELMRKDAN